MIFVTVGSQKFPFNRLLKVVDECVGKKLISEDVFAQIGSSTYYPSEYKYVNFLDHDVFESKLEKCDFVITHGGTGIIIRSLKLGKKVIAMPRLARYGEHVDDHQVQLLNEFEHAGLISICSDALSLSMAYEKALRHSGRIYQSTNDTFIADLDKYLSMNGGE